MARTGLVPLLVLVLALLISCALLPSVDAQLLASPAGLSLQQPLHLQGVDVGATMQRVGDQLTRHQELIDELLRRNSSNTALLQQYEQKFQELQQIIDEQQARIEQQRTRIEEIESNSTVILPGGGSSSVVEVVTQQQTLIDRLVERNSTVERVLGGVGQQLEQLGDKDAQLAQQIQQINNSLTTRIDEHSGQINTLSTLVDALLTPTIVHAVAGSEQATVRWSLASATVTAFPGDATCETDGLGGEQQCTVGGLTNGVNYTFTAQLTNAAGPGPVSPSSNSVVPQLDCHALSAATAGDGGVVTASPVNSVNCPPGEYVAGTVVIVTAIPDAGFGVSWSGPADGAADAALLTFSLRMPEAAATVVAAFARCFPLTVDVLAGSGSAVIAAPTNTAGCAAGAFVPGASVTLKATPAAGWSFSGWSGTVAAGFGTTVWSFVMPDSAATQRASFAQCLPLTVSRLPADGSGGSVSLSPSNSDGCPPGRFLQGVAVTLTASPAAGWGFAGWTGTLTSSVATWSYTMGSAAAVQTVRFGPCLSLTLQVSGSGTVSAAPTNSSGCPAGQYVPGAAITLSGTGIVGWTLTGWTGTQTRSNDHTAWSYTMPAAAATQTAQFAQCFQLSHPTTGPLGGVVSASPSFSYACILGRYVSGAALNLSVTAPSGATFLRWSGSGASGTSSPLAFTMPAATASVTAELAACVQVTVTASSRGTVSLLSNWSHTCASQYFPVGAPMTATALPNAGSLFKQWTGTYPGTSNPFAFTMPAALVALSAAYKTCRTLAVVADGCGTVGSPSPVSAECPAGQFVEGTSVSVLATASSNCTFTQWSGNSSSTAASLSFTIPAFDATLQANFKQCYPLSLLTAGATGTVAPNPIRSLACATNSFVAGAAFTIASSANGGVATFREWSGDASGTANPLTFTMPAGPASVTANLVPCVTLTAKAANSGSTGSVSATSAWSHTCTTTFFPEGAPVTVQALPGTGSTFGHWTGLITSTDNPLTFTMPGSISDITGSFHPCNALFLTASPSAGGTINTPIPASGNNCGAGKFGPFVDVTVTAVPNSGYGLVRWTGGAGTVNTPNVTLVYTTTTSGNSLTATFSLCVPAQTSVLAGSGSVSFSPSNSPGCAAGSFAAGATVTVTALPATFYVLDKWGGAASGTGDSATFTFTAGSIVQVSFKQRDFVYGQLAFTQRILNNPDVPATGLWFPSGLAVNAADELIVSDTNNHRILVYPFDSLTPTRVIGQADFVGKTKNRGLGASVCAANSLNSPVGVALDASGNMLVADSYNHRVLFFPASAGSSTSATRVYGQSSSYTTQTNTPITGASLSYPSGVAFGDGGVFIADAWNNRVLYYAGTSTTPTRIYGQSDPTSSAAKASGNDGFNMPRGLAVDASGGLYVTDLNNNRVLYFPQGQTTATVVLGQATFATNGVNRGLSAPTAVSLNGPQGVLVRPDGVYVGDYANRRLLRFPLGGTTADRVWGQPSFTVNGGGTLSNTTHQAYTAAFDSKGYMYVLDYPNHRVLRITP